MKTISNLLSQESPVTWLFTGDSITQGAGYTYGHRDYVQIFEERLRFELDRRLDAVLKTAVGGWTTQDMLDNVEWNIIRWDPQVVSIMIGMNDAASGPDCIDAFTDNYRRILDIVADRTSADVILHTPNPVIPGNAPARESALPLIVERVRDIGRERGLPVLDHWSHWQEAWGANERRAYSWMGNAIHPGPAGHRVFARLLLEELGIMDESSACFQLTIP